MSWVDWSISDLTAGFMYCCAVEDFRRAVPYAPNLTDDNGNWPDMLQ